MPSEQVPPLGKGSMYLRPLLLGTGATLGLQPAPEVTFVIFSAAVGSYFKGGTLGAIQLKIENRYHRAAPLGVGAAKCAGASQLQINDDLRVQRHACDKWPWYSVPNEKQGPSFSGMETVDTHVVVSLHSFPSALSQ